MPVPLMGTECGPPEALSAIVSVPVRVPVVLGRNVMEIEHAPETPRLVLLQLSELIWKSPVIVSVAMWTGTLPVLLTVTV